MDCDLRKGGVAQALGISNDKGLSNVLSGELDVSQVAQQYAPLPNLWVLTSGTVPFNPVRLLASQNMAALLERLAESSST